MGGGFGGCTINLVKNELYETFITTAKEKIQRKKFGRSPKVYDVVISDGSRKIDLNSQICELNTKVKINLISRH